MESFEVNEADSTACFSNFFDDEEITLTFLAVTSDRRNHFRSTMSLHSIHNRSGKSCLCVCDECNWPLCTLFGGNLVLTKLHKWCRHKDVCDDTSENFASCARTQVVCSYVTNYVCDFETRPVINK